MNSSGLSKSDGQSLSNLAGSDGRYERLNLFQFANFGRKAALLIVFEFKLTIPY